MNHLLHNEIATTFCYQRLPSSLHGVVVKDFEIHVHPTVQPSVFGSFSLSWAVTASFGIYRSSDLCLQDLFPRDSNLLCLGEVST